MELFLDCVTDVSLVVYVLIVVVSFLVGGLFAWWWVRMRHASEVYVYITLLIFSIGYANIFNLVARYSFISCDTTDTLTSILSHYTWQFKGVPILIMLVLIGLRMFNRVKKVLSAEKKSVGTSAHSALAKLLNIFEIICEEIRTSLTVARVAFNDNDIEKGCIKAMEVYAGSKKLEKAVSEFCRELNCAPEEGL